MNWGKLIGTAAPALFVIVGVTYLLDIFWDLTWFPEAIVAWGTLVLALATYQLGQTTIKENQKMREDNERIRKEDREENERIRKEELQRERSFKIRKWAEDAMGMLLIVPPPPNNEVKDIWERTSRENAYKFIISGSLLAFENADKLPHSKEISKWIEKVIKTNTEIMMYRDNPDADEKRLSELRFELLGNLFGVINAIE